MELNTWISLISALTALFAVFLSPILHYYSSKKQFYNQTKFQSKNSDIETLKIEIVKFLTAGSLYLEWKNKFNLKLCSPEEYNINTQPLFEKMLDTRHKVSFILNLKNENEISIYNKIQKCIDLLVLSNQNNYAEQLHNVSNLLSRELFEYINIEKKNSIEEYY